MKETQYARWLAVILVAASVCDAQNAPTKKLASAHSMFDKVPADVKPKKGSAWKEINTSNLKSWLNDNWIGQSVTLPVDLAEIPASKDGKITCSSSIKLWDWSGLTLYVGCKVVFDDEDREKLAKLNTSKPVSVTGKIGKIVLDPVIGEDGNIREAAFVFLLEDASIK